MNLDEYFNFHWPRSQIHDYEVNEFDYQCNTLLLTDVYC